MKAAMTLHGVLGVALVAIGFGASPSAQSADSNFSGISAYAYDPNPQEIAPKLYNWEITLSKRDSRNGAYEIVQVTSPAPAGPHAAASASTVIVESNLLVANENGIIDFKLYVGNKAPTQNMGRRGDIGEPIIFSGIGTAKAESSWIVLPGAKVQRVSPSPKGSRLSKGRLDLIQFVVSNDHGDRFRSDVMLRRK